MNQPTRRLLSVSRSTPLLIGRNDMLTMAGYSVSSPREPLDAILLLQHDEFLAVLIGHTVLADEADAIAAKAKSLRICAIYVYHGNVLTPEWADLSVESNDVEKLIRYLDKQGSASY